MSGIVACTQFEETHLTGVASDRFRLRIVSGLTSFVTGRLLA